MQLFCKISIIFKMYKKSELSSGDLSKRWSMHLAIVPLVIFIDFISSFKGRSEVRSSQFLLGMWLSCRKYQWPLCSSFYFYVSPFNAGANMMQIQSK